jgi:hypothetical protein
VATLRYPWERLEQLIGDRMGTDFGSLGELPNDLSQFAQWRFFCSCRIHESAMNTHLGQLGTDHPVMPNGTPTALLKGRLPSAVHGIASEDA